MNIAMSKVVLIKCIIILMYFYYKILYVSVQSFTRSVVKLIGDL